MKKKMMVGIFAMLLCFSLVGCKAGESKSKYPYVTVKRTMWRNDNTDIDIGGEYELNDFNKETTENGCTVTLNFDLKSKKKNKSTSETTKKENDTVQKSNSRFKLDVEPVLQLPELPTGCEITSLATVLNYYGYDISKTQLADEYLECGEVGDTDPNEKFIGSPYDIHSYGCFSNVIADAAKSFSEKNGCNFKVYNLYGLSLDDLYKYVEDGKPVVIWSTIDLKETYRNITWDVDGKEIAWRANEHCMVLIGYDKDNDTCIVSDPLQGIKEYPRDLFNQRYEELGKQAVVVEKSI